MSYLIDTNVISEMRKYQQGKANPNFSLWLQHTDYRLMRTSVISLLEIERGIWLKEQKDPAQGAILRQWFTDFVLPVLM